MFDIDVCDIFYTIRLRKTSYRGFSSDSFNSDQGVHDCRLSIPFSQKTFNNAGENPDIIDALDWVDRLGNPVVDLKFQNRICGGFTGSPNFRRPISAYLASMPPYKLGFLKLRSPSSICISLRMTSTISSQSRFVTVLDTRIADRIISRAL